MKKLNLITEFDKYYKGSDLQKIVNNQPLPIKYTINDFECYFYNADLFGLFELKITKDGLTTNDFINDYKDGFIKGLNHLKEIEKIKIKDIKNTNSRSNTILQIQKILFEREFQFGSKGLINLVFKKIPLIFTEKNIYDYGYWNGIIHSIENLCNITGLTKNDLETLQPQQNETVKLDEVKKELHNDTFKFNAFEVFEIYKEKKEITAQSRTDLRIIFDLLKSDNLLLDTIELKHFINWLNRVYFNGDIGELRVQNLKSKPNIIRTNDYKVIRDTTLKKP